MMDSNNEVQMEHTSYFDRIKHFFLSTIHLIHEDKKRSYQGGHYKTRIMHDPRTDVTVEEIELFCNTLKFDSIVDSTKKNKE
jgi:hypothetical protein